MYRVEKVLNHNTVIAIHGDSHKEYLIMGKGVGFGKKINERMKTRPEDSVYSLQKSTERGDAGKIAKSISPICLEIANEVLNQAEKSLGKIDRNMLFPMADHIEFAVKRIKNQEQIPNPLTADIRILFHAEYKVAQCIEDILKERLGIQIDEHEIGYIALHIHSALEDENVSQAMQMAQAVRTCISMVEQETGKKIDVLSLSYKVLRVQKGEELKVSMNDYMEFKFPKSFQIAQTVCDQLGRELKLPLSEEEIGYLAIHIERVTTAERDE